MGDDGGSQAGWWLGGEEAQKEPKPDVEEGVGGEQAIDAWEGPEPVLELHSDALSLENMVMASGKLGGVAGVFLGVHIWGGGGGEAEEAQVKICYRKIKTGSESLLSCYRTCQGSHPARALPKGTATTHPTTRVCGNDWVPTL